MNAKDCCDILTQAGIRPTSTRILVYEAIAEEKTPSLWAIWKNVCPVSTSQAFSVH